MLITVLHLAVTEIKINPSEFHKNTDGSFLIAGNEVHPLFEPPGEWFYPSITKLLPCGIVDSSYGVNGKFTGINDFGGTNSQGASFIFTEDGGCIITGHTGRHLHYPYDDRPLITKLDTMVAYNITLRPLL